MHATDIAVKRPKPNVKCTLQAEEQFWKEVLALSRVRHPSIIALLGGCPEHHMLVYEFFGGGSLHERLSHGGAAAGSAAECAQQCRYQELTWSQRLHIMLQVASGLDYLHGQGILHM
jgi:serine/threonine protein kinase